MSQNNNSVKKLGNGSYNIDVEVEDFDLDTSKSITGKFQVGVFEKNFGTFLEDTKDVLNVDCIEVKCDGILKDFIKDFNFLERNKIKQHVVSSAHKLLKNYLYGSE